MSRAIILQHAAYQGPGRIVPIFRDFGIPTEVRHLYKGDEVPTDLDEVRVLIMLDGPMAVTDVGSEKFPFLAKEVETLKRLVQFDRPTLGIGLGAQLLAHAAGAKVHPNVKPGPKPEDPTTPAPEFGWGGVQFPFPGGTDPLVFGAHEGAPMFHWHTDTFELPKLAPPPNPAPPPAPAPPTGNVLLSSSRLCKNQAFRFKSRLVGFQYHFELTEPDVEAMVANRKEDLTRAGLPTDIESKIREETKTHYTRYARLGDRLLNNYVQFLKAYDPLSWFEREAPVVAVMDVLHQFRRYLTKPHVRPWALCAPILVLLVCLPLLRPLRHPDPREISNDELARLATIESVVERRTLAIDDSTFLPTAGTTRRGDHVFSAQPPTLAVLLAGPYWLMHRSGLTFDKNPALVAYLLTLIGATIPVAMAAGLIYRMGRLFELPRRRRTLLATAVAFGSGLVSYGVVLNAHAPAAALVLGSAACIVHVAISRRPGVTSGWLAIAGLCAAVAATIDPAAVVFVVLFAFAVLAMRWHWALRVGGVALYALGVAPALFLHAGLAHPISGEVVPPQWRDQFVARPTSADGDAQLAAAKIAPAINPPAINLLAINPTTDEADDEDATTSRLSAAAAPSGWTALGSNLARVAATLFGEHGIFSHFPVILLGLFGVAAVMHRHWPKTTKLLAGGTIAGAVAIIVSRCVIIPTGPGAMFGPQAFVLFLPLTLFWAGAWMRRPHGAVKWTLAGVLLLFSMTVTLIGATDPQPRDGFDHYTAVEAATKLMNPVTVTPQNAILAGR